MLDEYSSKEKRILGEEKLELKDIDLILRKESKLLEHLEAKSPPPKHASIGLIKEPIFTHWVARVFSDKQLRKELHNFTTIISL